MNDFILSNTNLEKTGYLTNIDNIGIVYRNIYEFNYNPVQKLAVLESIISKYKQQGIKFIRLIDPNSFLILYDYKNKKLIIKTDAIGHFNLYYHIKGRNWYFCENLSTLASHLKTNLEKTSFFKYILLGYIPGENTIFKEIKKIPPFHLLYNEYSNIRSLKYGNISVPLRFHNENTYITKSKSILQKILNNFSKQNTGIMISGGVDSTLLLSLIKNCNKNIKTFTLGVEKYSDNLFFNCRKVADYFTTDHREIKISIGDYLNYFLKSYCSLNEPIFDLDLPALCYFLKNPATKVDFMLHGYGSDEIFGGIPAFFIKRYAEFKKNYKQYDILKTKDTLAQSMHSALINEVPQRLNSAYKALSSSKIKLIFPYFDYRIVKLAFNMPSKLKFNKGIDKIIIRELSKKLFPHNLAFRKKESSDIPLPWKKIIIDKYYVQLKKSPVIKKIINNIDTFRNKPSFLLKFIIFDLWAGKITNYE